MEEEFALLVDGLVSHSSISQCRICHEEEREEGPSKSLETPCACSGTLKVRKREMEENFFWVSSILSLFDVLRLFVLSFSCQFAHRECIQRWCDEKGDTTCEICLQVSVLSRKWDLGFALI